MEKRIDNRIKTLLVVAVGLLAVLGGCTGGADPTPTPPQASPTPSDVLPSPTPSPTPHEEPFEIELEPSDCLFEAPPGYAVQCGLLTVPENWGSPGERTVKLPFAVFQSPGNDRAEDPIVYLSGGPGQSALELVPLAFPLIYEPLIQDRDLVVLDQRGTGWSEPSLACDEYKEAVFDLLEGAPEPAEATDRLLGALQECRDRLSAEGIELSAYNSANSAADVDALRNALGYDQWNVYGISYGSRLALTLMRDYPEGIRSVILDSAYPLEADIFVETPGNFLRSLDLLLDACGEDPSCEAAFPELRATLTSLLDRLEAEPADYTITDPMTGRAFAASMTAGDMLGLLFAGLYEADLIAYLPELIHGAHQGRFETLGLLQSILLMNMDLVSIGMQFSVQCGEEAPFSDPEAVAEAGAAPELRDMFESAVNLGSPVFDACRIWDVEAAPAIENEPVVSDIPALVLAGEFDPITPPAWGEMTAGNLANSQFFVFPGVGHGTVPAHECVQQITQDFLREPAAMPDADCIATMEPPVFAPADVDVAMRPYQDVERGFSTVVPEDWAEVIPGVYQESLFVALTVLAIPGVTPEQLLGQLAMQVGLDGAPDADETRSTAVGDWDLYRLQDQGQEVDLALMSDGGLLYMVQLATTPQRRSAYYDQVFLQAVEDFRLGQ